MPIEFADETAVPTRPSTKTNEFRDVVAWLAENRGKVKSYVVNGVDETDTKARVAYDIRKMAEAGNDLPTPVTMITRQEKLSDKSVKVFMSARDKIKRRSKGKPAVETPAKPAEKSAK